MTKEHQQVQWGRTLCPHCGHETPAEPDATTVYCVHCRKRFTPL